MFCLDIWNLGPAGNQHSGEAHCTLVLSSEADILNIHNDVSVICSDHLPHYV